MSLIAEVTISLFLILGASFALIGSIGLARLPDFFCRLHGPTKSTTLGVGGMLVASAVFFSVRQEGLSLHEILVTVFLFLTAPVGAHILAKAAIHSRQPEITGALQHHAAELHHITESCAELASKEPPRPKNVSNG